MPGSSTSFQENRGNVNSGSGALHVHNYGPTAEEFVRRGRDLGAVAREHLARLDERFVEPPGYAEARKRLGDHGCVLVTGQAGVGRRAAAQMLLSRPRDEHLIKELSDTPDRPGGPILDTNAVLADDRLLLDLSVSEDEPFRAVLRELPSFQAKVREDGARLAVILPDGQDHDPPPELRPMLVNLDRPRGVAVLRSHLRAEDVRVDDPALLDTEKVRPLLEAAPMRELAELALFVRGMSGSLSSRLDAAVDVLTDRMNKIRELARKKSRGDQRALLLAAAMFAAPPADAVHHAAARLLDTVGHPDDERPPLERTGLADRLGEIGVSVGRSGRARFVGVAYEPAVRAYFWDNFPDLRPQLREWADRVVTSGQVPSEDLTGFVTRFAEQALRTDRPDDLSTLVDRWVDRNLAQAAAALESGLTDGRHGGVFRRHVYNWSRRNDLPARVARLAIGMCAEVIAPTHPAEALVRLHHLVRRQRGSVRDAALDALLDLVTRDRRQFRLLLERIETGLGRSSPADAALFLALTDHAGLLDSESRARPLIEDPNVRRTLVPCWRAVLIGQPPDRWADPIRQWLTAAVNARFRDPLLTVLVDSCADVSPTAARLYVTARDWSRSLDADRAARRGVALRLKNLLDQAQGVSPVRAGSGHRTKETTT